MLIETAIITTSIYAAHNPEGAFYLGLVAIAVGTPTGPDIRSLGPMAWILSSAGVTAYNVVQFKNENTGLDVFFANFVGWNAAVFFTDFVARKTAFLSDMQFTPVFDYSDRRLGGSISFRF